MNTSKEANVLRLDIAHRDVIYEERRVTPLRPMVVFLREDDTRGEMVRLHELFCYAEGCWHLRLTRHIVGRITDGKSDSPPCVLPDFNDVKEFMQGKSPDKTGVWEVSLGPNARGRIKIGDFTILFHFAPTPSPVLN